jgi:hypothetical protein
MSPQKVWQEELTINSDSLGMTLDDLIREGKARRVIVKNARGKTILRLPLWLGALAAAKDLSLAAVAALGTMSGHLTIVVERVEEDPQQPPEP